MPPRRKVAVVALEAESSTRSSRAKARAAAAAAVESKAARPKSPPPVPSKRNAAHPVSKAGTKRKRTSTETTASLEIAEDEVEVPVKVRVTPLSTSKSNVSKAVKKAKSPVTVKKRSALSTPWSTKTCLKWFSTYEEDGAIIVTTLTKWFEELDISMEGPVFYILAWKSNAKHAFTLLKDEFYTCMAELQVDCNEKLLHKLPSIISSVSPSYDDHNFLEFYKFCFNYFKVKDMKNLPVDMASELFKSLLDTGRYSLTWKPPPDDTAETVDLGVKGMTPGLFPHLRAFLEYLNQDPKPVNVITKDQYTQFIPFNRDVPWDLRGYKEDESAWPSLMDNYIIWRKEKYPESVRQEKIEDDEIRYDYHSH